MRLSFFSQLLLDKEKTGIGWCADNIVKELSKYQENECELDFFAMRHTEEKYKQFSDYVKNGCSLNPCRFFVYILYKLIWNIFPIPYHTFFGRKENIHIFFNYVVPPGVKGKKVVFVYDMAYKSCPGTVYSKTRKWLNFSMPSTMRRADKIITISEFSKKEIINYFDVNEKDIIVIPMGVNSELYHNKYTESDRCAVKNKYGIEADYFLYLGTLEPRKNIVNIIEAYQLLKRKRNNQAIPKLVLAGRKGWMYEEIFNKINVYDLEDDVIFTGYIEEKDAPILMGGAIAFLFPSLYEGFGMPPLEAMACGTPVITSNTSALPEVVGDAGILIDPFKINELKNAMELLISNLDMREVLIKQGSLRAEKFTWSAAADILMDEFRQMENN